MLSTIPCFLVDFLKEAASLKHHVISSPKKDTLDLLVFKRHHRTIIHPKHAKNLNNSFKKMKNVNFMHYSSTSKHAKTLDKNTASYKDLEPILITTPIFYVNAEPHIGHLYSTLLADALARWHRILGHPTKMTTGTDEHGIKVKQAAEAANRPPQEFCDIVSSSFSRLWKKANIQVDDYIRTTEPRHLDAVQAFWQKLYDHDQIYKGEFSGWYAISDEAFLTPLQVKDEMDPNGHLTGRKIAIETGSVVTWIKEENYKFRLSKWEQKLAHWIENQAPIVPTRRNRDTLNDVQSGLLDLSVSRLKTKNDWGIIVPNDHDHLIYVWLDALVNYLTVCQYPHWNSLISDKNKACNNGVDTELKNDIVDERPINGNIRDTAYLDEHYWPAAYHIIGKDIIKFHAIYWPAFLLAAGLEPPRKIITHAHWTRDKRKISKSTGNTIDPNQILDKYGVDPTRYFLLRQGGIHDDADYSDQEIENVISAELSNCLGNLIMRCTSKALNPSRKWPHVPTYDSLVFGEEERKIVQQLDQIIVKVDQWYKNGEFNCALPAIFSMLAEVNLYFTQMQPWKLVSKSINPDIETHNEGKESILQHAGNQESILNNPDGNALRLQCIIYVALESIRISSLLLQPIMPEKMGCLLDYIGIPHTHRNPYHWQFGYDYSKYATKSVMSDEAFLLLDQRIEKRIQLEKRKLRSTT